MDLNQKYSKRMLRTKSSAIREILKVTANPEVISFAGGLPSVKSFPVDQLKNAFEKVLVENPYTALQYSTTDGYIKLREWVAEHKSTPEHTVSPDEVIIVSGSQQALDLLGKLFINAGDKVLVETPTYLGALQAFDVFEPEFISVASDEDGMIANQISAQDAADAKFIYALPNFQNPTGRLMSEQRRQDLTQKARELDLLVIEDDPYGELWYQEPPSASLLSRMPERVIQLGTFSKILSPGLRLGFVVAPYDIVRKLEVMKQATDLHTSTLTQHAIYQAINDGFLERHIPTIRKLYHQRANAMLEALQNNMPEGVRWNQPKGGMFLWVTLPEHLNSQEVLKKAIEKNVAFVPGAPFYANPENIEPNTLRLAFVTVEIEKIQEGIQILSQVIKNML